MTNLAIVAPACSSCGESESTELFRGCEHEYDTTTDAYFPVVRCNGCGLVRLCPRPDVTELSRIYPPEYYAYHLVEQDRASKQNMGWLTRTTRRITTRRMQRWFERLVARVDSDKPKLRVLDIGCGDGRLLDFYRSSKVGHRVETWGVDMDAGSVATARERGHHAVHARFEDASELENGSFDLILTSHVIEHVADPTDFCRRARDLLAPGGMFVVATPNFDSADARYFGPNWGGCHFPRHWTFYDADTLGRVVDRLGLRVRRVDYDPNPYFWVWTAHSLLRRRNPGATWPDRLFPTVAIFQASIYNFFLLAVFTALDLGQRALTGKTGSMTVEIQKPRLGAQV